MSLFTKIKNRSRWLISFPVDWIRKQIYTQPDVRSVDETLDYILQNKASVSRYGDGELDIMSGRDIPFQKYNPELAQKMRDILQFDANDYVVCINDVFGDCDQYVDFGKQYWKRNMRRNRKIWNQLLKPKKIYFNADMTRPYINYIEKAHSPLWFDKLKKIWTGKDIVIVEGAKSRLGVGNDLFDSASSVKRILGPVKNAFGFYDDLVQAVCNLPKDTLVLIALGPTATAMAYDLYKKGYQAIDIGHVDIEYEWMLMGATTKVPVKNKYTNEASFSGGIDVVEDLQDLVYQSEIINRIGIE